MNPNPLMTSIPGSQSGPDSSNATRFKPLDPLRVLRENIRMLIISGLAGVVIGLITWGVCLLLVPIYSSEALLRVSMGLDNVMSTTTGENTRGANADILDRYIKGLSVLITSDELLYDVLASNEIKGTPWFKRFDDNTDALEGIKDDLRVYPIRDSDLIALNMSSIYKDDIPKVINGVISVFLKRVNDETSRNSQGVNRTFRKEREDAEDEMQTLEELLQTFLDDNDIRAMNIRDSEAQIKYARAIEEIIVLTESLAGQRTAYNQALQMQAQGSVQATPEALMAVEMDPSVRALSDQIIGMNARRDALTEQGYGEKHAMVQSVDSQISAVKQQKKLEVERRLRERQEAQIEMLAKAIEGMENQMEKLQTAADEATTQLQDLAQKLERYEKLKADFEKASVRYTEFDTALRQMQVGSSRPDTSRVKIYHEATKPELSFPKAIIVIPGVTILVFGMAVSFLFLKELMDQRIKTPADVRMIQSCDLLGVLPFATEDPSGPARIEGVVQKDPTGLMAESFRKVRTELLARIDKDNLKTILFVGAQPQCGTSAVVSNLATSIAYNKRRVLIIDANIRRPGQHKLHGVAAAPGLVDVLGNNTNLDQAMIKLDESHVDLLPVGTAVYAQPELLESQVFADLLSRLSEQYDVILIDSPPGLLASDSLLVAKHVDAIAFVVRAHNDKRGMLNRMVRQFEKGRAVCLGVIINGIRSSAGGYFQKNYEEFYRYRQAAGSNTDAEKQTPAKV